MHRRISDLTPQISHRSGVGSRGGSRYGSLTAARYHRHALAYRYRLLEPGGVQRRVELDPFKVVGRFTIKEQKNGKAASEAFKALERPGE